MHQKITIDQIYSEQKFLNKTIVHEFDVSEAQADLAKTLETIQWNPIWLLRCGFYPWQTNFKELVINKRLMFKLRKKTKRTKNFIAPMTTHDVWLHLCLLLVFLFGNLIQWNMDCGFYCSIFFFQLTEKKDLLKQCHHLHMSPFQQRIQSPNSQGRHWIMRGFCLMPHTIPKIPSINQSTKQFGSFIGFAAAAAAIAYQRTRQSLIDDQRSLIHSYSFALEINFHFYRVWILNLKRSSHFLSLSTAADDLFFGSPKR